MAPMLEVTLSHFTFSAIWAAVTLVVNDNKLGTHYGALTRGDDYYLVEVEALACCLECLLCL